MPIQAACPKCQTRYNAPDTAGGKKFRCQKCGNVFPVNTPAAPAVPEWLADVKAASPSAPPRTPPAPARIAPAPTQPSEQPAAPEPAKKSGGALIGCVVAFLAVSFLGCLGAAGAAYYFWPSRQQREIAERQAAENIFNDMAKEMGKDMPADMPVPQVKDGKIVVPNLDKGKLPIEVPDPSKIDPSKLPDVKIDSPAPVAKTDPPAKPNPEDMKPTAPMDSLVGKWKWVDGKSLTALADGTFDHEGKKAGTWKESDAAKRQYQFRWSAGFVDDVTLSADGNTLDGKNQFGRRITASRVATPDSPLKDLLNVPVRIVNRGSGKGFGPAGKGMADGTGFLQWSYQKTDVHMHYKLVAVDGDWIQIENPYSGSLVSVMGDSSNDGAAIVLWKKNEGAAYQHQQWKLVPVAGADGFYKVLNRGSGKVISVHGRATNDGAQMVLWSDTANAASQEFKLERVDGAPTGTDPKPDAMTAQLANWEKIRPGMSYPDVVQLIGMSQLQKPLGGTRLEMIWRDKTGPKEWVIVFDQGKVVSKSERGGTASAPPDPKDVPAKASAETKEVQDKAIAVYKKLGADYKMENKRIVEINLGLRNVSDKSMPTLVQPFTRCRELILSGTKITDETLVMIKDFTELEVLAVAGTQVTDKGLENLKDKKKLRILNVTGCKITDAGMEHLKDLTRMNALLLGKTEITDKSLEVIKGYKGLEHLELFECKAVTEQGKEDLIKALPKLKKLDNRPFIK